MMPNYVLVSYKVEKIGHIKVDKVEFPVDREQLLQEIIDIANEKVLNVADEGHIEELDDLMDVYPLTTERLSIERLQDELEEKVNRSEVASMETNDIIRNLGEFTESGNDSYIKQLVRELTERVV